MSIYVKELYKYFQSTLKEVVYAPLCLRKFKCKYFSSIETLKLFIYKVNVREFFTKDRVKEFLCVPLRNLLKYFQNFLSNMSAVSRSRSSQYPKETKTSIFRMMYRPSSGFQNFGRRIVPPFSIESLQKNTKVVDPPKPQGKAHNQTITQSKTFRMYYERGDLPIRLEYLTGGDKISWTVEIDKLDYGLYLPLFFDGLSETKHPYKTYARQGVQDLLAHGGEKIYSVIPQLIIPIKSK